MRSLQYAATTVSIGTVFALKASIGDGAQRSTGPNVRHHGSDEDCYSRFVDNGRNARDLSGRTFAAS